MVARAAVSVLQAPAERHRLAELDALRGLAACGVLLYHYTTQFGLLYGHSGPLNFHFALGLYGVHLFFVISGFVIFMTLERTPRALDFVVSRFSRLFPAYWTALAITLGAIALAGLPDQHFSTRDVAVNVTMLADFFNAREVDGSYWTLQVELFFYAQMLFWFVVGGLRHIRIVILGWIALALAYGLAARFDLSLSYLVREITIARYIPFFAAGVVLFRISQRRDPLWQNLLLIAGCALAAGAVWSPVYALTLVACAGIFGLMLAGQLRFLARQPFLYLGTISYTLYLVHQDIGYMVISKLERAGIAPLAALVAAAAVALALATALTYIVERPAMHGIRSAYRALRTRMANRAIRRPA